MPDPEQSRGQGGGHAPGWTRGRENPRSELRNHHNRRGSGAEGGGPRPRTAGSSAGAAGTGEARGAGAGPVAKRTVGGARRGPCAGGPRPPAARPPQDHHDPRGVGLAPGSDRGGPCCRPDSETTARLRGGGGGGAGSAWAWAPPWPGQGGPRGVWVRPRCGQALRTACGRRGNEVHVERGEPSPN